MRAEYPKVERSQILRLLNQYPNHRTRVIEGVQALSKGLPVASTSSPIPSSTVPRPSTATLHTASPRVQVPQGKSRKNENSAIYAKRGNDGKKRNASGSESEGKMSDAESEMDWSDEEGPRRKKKKNEDVMDPETVALKAFNSQTAEELTGTIGRPA